MKLPSVLKRPGIRLRLTFSFLLAFGGLFSLFSAGMYFHVVEAHRKEFDAALYNYVVDLSHTIKDEILRGKSREHDFSVTTEMILPFSLGETLLQVSNPDGSPVLRSQNLGDRLIPLPKIREGQTARLPYFVDLKFPRADKKNGPLARHRVVSIQFHRQDKGFWIQAAVPMILLDRQDEGLLFFLTIGVPLFLVLAMLIALSLSRKAMAPVSEMIQKANEIEARHLSNERIPVPENRDEIRKLALTLNGLLDRMAQAFKAQEVFISDASHQLKTPLSILKGELEVFSQSRSQESIWSERKGTEGLSEFLESAKHEINYLVAIVEDLLLLARMESGTERPNRELFRFDEKVVESVARLGKKAQEQGVTLSVDLLSDSTEGESFDFAGDPELMRSLIENLVDNAIKFSPKESAVSISLKDEREGIRLEVSDQGPGISLSALPHVFKRFYRAEETRHRISGSGLGLSIVKRIAELHEGSITAENLRDGGASFTVFFPFISK